MAISCVPADLVKKANCFQCVPKASRRSVRSYLLCSIAKVGLKGGGMMPVAAPTGFATVITAQGLQAPIITASWTEPPPAGFGITGVEVWTSSDGITYALSTTVALGTGHTNLIVPAVGSFLYIKIRWTNGTQVGPFASPLETSGRAADWLHRAHVNAGAPSANTIAAVNTFDCALNTAGIDTLMQQVLLLCPPDLGTALTPLYKVFGNDPWVNNGPFVVGDLTINGLAGDAATKWLDSGVVPSVSFISNNNGLSVYVSVIGGTPGQLFGSTGGGLNELIDPANNGGANTVYGSQTITVSTPPATAGFYSGSRTSGTFMGYYYASSGNAWALITSNAGASGAFNANSIALMLNHGGGSFSNSRCSYCSIHQGFSSAQGQAEFNAVQAFRTAIGGGSV